MIKMNNQKINIAFPAVVVGIDRLEDGFIDVKPVVNHMNSLNGETLAYPTMKDIQVIFPSSKNSTISFPLVQGDTVDLVFQSVDIDDFVNGNKQQHDPFTTGYGNLKNVVAVVGFNTYQDSCFNPLNYSGEFNKEDLNIVHNKNSPNEASISINPDGDIKLRSPTVVQVESKKVQVVSDEVDVGDAIVSTQGDYVLRGKSIQQFMEEYYLHKHTGNQGSPTSTPIGV